MSSYPVYDGSRSRLYMRFDKILRSAQGMAVWHDEAFILYDTGACAVYDLKTRAEKPLASFRLASFNEGMPSADYKNHANHCMFVGTHYQGNPIPLLYVTTGAGTGADEDGYYYRLSVENIVRTGEGYQAHSVQTITYQPSDTEGTPWVAPCWGCPAFFADTEEKALYIFSARYRTKRGCVPEGEKNAYIITRFPLPEVQEGTMIRLSAKDIQDQFVVESDVEFTQGGQLTGGVLYYTFGCPKIGYPDRMMAFDVHEKKALYMVDHLDEALCGEEIECCDWYEGKLLCNTCDGGLYVLDWTKGAE